MEFIHLTTDLLEFRLVEEPGLDRDWFVSHIGDIIAFNPQGCFALTDGDKVIGMVTTTCYQTVGWIGWLYVAERYRQHGFGERLMHRAVEHIRTRGIKTIVLEAVVKAVPLYERLGFVQQFKSEHYLLEPQQFTPVPNTNTTVRNVSEWRLNEVTSFDEQLFCQNRSRLFEIVFRNRIFDGLVAEVGGKIAGLLFLMQDSKKRRVSPMTVDLTHDNWLSIMSALVRAAFASSSKTLYFRCPLVQPDRAVPLMQLGAQPVGYHTVRMSLGAPYEPEKEGIFSSGCPGKG